MPRDEEWQKRLSYDAIGALLASGNPAVVYFANRDLLDLPVPQIQSLWTLRQPRSILSKQQEDGRWSYRQPGSLRPHPDGYDQLETYRQLVILIDCYGLTAEHPAVSLAAMFLFSRQTSEGDFRGIYGQQYSPNYSAAILEVLIKAGYAGDGRIEAAFRWFKSTQQSEGGWALPFRTRGYGLEGLKADELLEPDYSQPCSHFVSGIVLRAYAAHSNHIRSPEAERAARLVKTRMFRRDAYSDRGSPEFWTKFSYPFWQTDILSLLDTLSRMGFSKNDTDIDKAIAWLLDRQTSSGLFNLNVIRGNKTATLPWLTLAICRTLKRFHLNP